MHPYDSSLSEDYTVRVVLPEGSHNIRLELPQNFEIDNYELTKYFGTLDFFGRPMLVITKKNAVHELLDHTMKVHYEFNNSTDLYLEPIIMFGMILVVFFVAIIYSRIELTLDNLKRKVKDEDKDE